MFKTKFIIFIFRVSGGCKAVGAFLWYIEQEVFKTNFIIFIFRVSGSCKDVGALLWYIEQEVRLGNNQWHVPPKKQRLHGPSILSEIETKKLRQDKFCERKTTKQTVVQSLIQELK